MDRLPSKRDETITLRDALAEERRRYRELQELTGSALFRAHVIRGDKELDVAKLLERVDQLEGILREVEQESSGSTSEDALVLNGRLVRILMLARAGLGAE